MHGGMQIEDYEGEKSNAIKELLLALFSRSQSLLQYLEVALRNLPDRDVSLK